LLFTIFAEILPGPFFFRVVFVFSFGVAVAPSADLLLGHPAILVKG
jgi:hypothetical protein